MVFNGTSVLISNSMFENVGARQEALLVASNSTLVVYNSIFSGNTGTTSGSGHDLEHVPIAARAGRQPCCIVTCKGQHSCRTAA